MKPHRCLFQFSEGEVHSVQCTTPSFSSINNNRFFRSSRSRIQINGLPQDEYSTQSSHQFTTRPSDTHVPRLQWWHEYFSILCLKSYHIDLACFPIRYCNVEDLKYSSRTTSHLQHKLHIRLFSHETGAKDRKHQ